MLGVVGNMSASKKKMLGCLLVIPSVSWSVNSKSPVQLHTEKFGGGSKLFQCPLLRGLKQQRVKLWRCKNVGRKKISKSLCVRVFICHIFLAAQHLLKTLPVFGESPALRTQGRTLKTFSQDPLQLKHRHVSWAPPIRHHSLPHEPSL